MTDVMERPGTEASTQSERAQEVTLRPPADVYEQSDRLVLLLDVPGVSKERLDLQTDHNSLVIEAQAEIDMPEGMEALYADVRSTRFRRSFSLAGEQLDVNAIEASLKDGVLRIEIPKRAEHRPRKIEIKTQ
jgi:HSP20 family protein